MGETGRGTDGRETKDAAAAAKKKVPFLGMFRYTDRLDVLLMVVGTVGVLGNGLSEPLMAVLFGNVINSFGENTSGSVLRSVTKVVLNFIYLGIGTGVMLDDVRRKAVCPHPFFIPESSSEAGYRILRHRDDNRRSSF